MKRHRDQRLGGLLLTLALIALMGGAITLLPGPHHQPPPVATADAKLPATSPRADAARRLEVEQRFKQAVVMLHARQYDYAVKALHRVLELSPQLVEAHVNMGYALLGLNEYRAAHDFFLSATELRPTQANAYFGMAEALEGMGDMAGAIGAMRTFIHLSAPDTPFLPRARAALWEWQQQRDAAGGRERTADTNPSGLLSATVLESEASNTTQKQ